MEARQADAGLRGWGVAEFVVCLRQRGIISCLWGWELLLFCGSWFLLVGPVPDYAVRA